MICGWVNEPEIESFFVPASDVWKWGFVDSVVIIGEDISLVPDTVCDEALNLTMAVDCGGESRKGKNGGLQHVERQCRLLMDSQGFGTNAVKVSKSSVLP